MNKVCIKCNTEFVIADYMLKKKFYMCNPCRNKYARLNYKSKGPKVKKRKLNCIDCGISFTVVANYCKRCPNCAKPKKTQWKGVYNRKSSNDLADSYIKTQLHKRSIKATPEIIEQKRLQLMIKRRIKELKQINPQL